MVCLAGSSLVPGRHGRHGRGFRCGRPGRWQGGGDSRLRPRKGPPADPEIYHRQILRASGQQHLSGDGCPDPSQPDLCRLSVRGRPHAPDGVTVFQSDPREIARQLRQQAQRIGWPEGELDRLVEARDQGLACWWVREGSIEAVQVSPDTGPHGGRAQRVQVGAAASGIAQWIFLPLHRVRKYEFEILARSPDVAALGRSPLRPGRPATCERRPCRDCRAIGACCAARWRSRPGRRPTRCIGWRSRRVLRPVRHRPCPLAARRSRQERRSGRRAAIEAIAAAALALAGRKLRQRLPLGGWRRAVRCSADQAKLRLGWRGDEPLRDRRVHGFLRRRRLRADDLHQRRQRHARERQPGGCNTATVPPIRRMGQRRAAAGHPAPYNVRHWEIGNELWGHWQCRWTTAAGYAGSLPTVPQGDARRRPDDPALRLRRSRAGRAAVEPDADPRCRRVADGHHRSSADRWLGAAEDRPAWTCSATSWPCPTCWLRSGAGCSRIWRRPASLNRGWR